MTCLTGIKTHFIFNSRFFKLKRLWNELFTDKSTEIVVYLQAKLKTFIFCQLNKLPHKIPYFIMVTFVHKQKNDLIWTILYQK